MKTLIQPQHQATSANDRFNHSDQSSTSPFVISIGIDWADREHAFAATLPDGSIEQGTFKQNPEVIERWVGDWQKRFPDARLEVGIETSRGALINAERKVQIRLPPLGFHDVHDADVS